MYTIAWLLFIVACILAVPIAALIDSQRRKKLQREALMPDDGADDYQGDADIVLADDGEDFAEPVEASPFDDAMPVADAEPNGDDGLFDDVLPQSPR